MADFLLVAKRCLTPAEYRILSYHHLLGADWRLCCRKLNIGKGAFFHSLYRVQSQLGRVFRELKPYSLFPVEDYFSRRTVNTWPYSAEVKKLTAPPRSPALGKPINVPFLRAA